MLLVLGLLRIWLDAFFPWVLPDLFLVPRGSFPRGGAPPPFARFGLMVLALSPSGRFALYFFFYFYFHGALIWGCQIWFAALFCIALQFLLFFLLSFSSPLHCSSPQQSHASLSICFSPFLRGIGAFLCLDELQAHTNPPLF
jgi:hypothetical protein